MNMVAKRLREPVGQRRWADIRLQRDGVPPLRFSGRLLGRHEGGAPGMTAWHDLALYDTATRQFVVEIVAWRGAFGEKAYRSCSHALPAATLDAALSLLTSHDPVGDIWPTILIPAETVGTPWQASAQIALEVAALYAACHDTTLHYRRAVGRLLAGLAWIFV
jgi:hypothetical protein